MKKSIFVLIALMIIAVLSVSSCIKFGVSKTSEGESGTTVETTKSPDDKDTQKANKNDRGKPNSSGPPWGRGNRENYTYSIAAVTMDYQSISEVITLSGDIQAEKSVVVTPDANGSLSRILVYEGKKVKKGDTIAYVDASKAGQSYLPSPVKTPISGIVASLPIKVGNTVSISQVVATIADNSKLEIKLAIPEKYVGKIDEDTIGSLTTLAFRDKRFDIKMKTMSAVLSTATHTMPVTMEFEQSGNQLRSGMYATIELFLDTKPNALVLSRDTIIVRLVDNENKIGVYRVVDGDNDEKIASFAEVELGIENNNNIEIVSGLQKGDVVITQGQSALTEGSKVRVFNLDGKELISVEDEIKRLQENPDATGPQVAQPRGPGGRG